VIGYAGDTVSTLGDFHFTSRWTKKSSFPTVITIENQIFGAGVTKKYL